jgi:hypothetical protein
MKLSVLAVACVVAALDPTLSIAAPDASGNIMVLGIGAHSCGSWTSDRETNSAYYLDDMSWILGYVTSFNAWGGGTSNAGGDTDNLGIIAWIDNYCSSHPLSTINQAATNLILALYVQTKSSR